MKAKYFGKEIILDDEIVEGRDEFDSNINIEEELEKTKELDINLENTIEINIGDNNE